MQRPEREYTCSTCGFKSTQEIPTGDAHVFGDWVKVDDTKCSRTCTLCKTATETSEHFWDLNEAKSTPATCGSEGKNVFVCSKCHLEKTETVAKLATHRWNLPGNPNSSWHSVGLDLPHERICPDCGTKETEAHAFDGGRVTTPSTCAVEGVRTFTCLCGQTKTEPVAKTTLHDVEKKWVADATGHWYECRVCHSRIDKAAHTPGPAATETAPQVCTICNYEIAPIVPHSHSYSTAWKSDAKDHWHYCTVCQDKTDVAAHSFDNACDPDCNICGYTRKVEHTPETKWSSNEEYHWHTCSKCGTFLDKAAHQPGPAATEKAPQTCKVCGFVIKPALNHTHNYDKTLSSDATGHWYACSGCSEKKDFADHVYDNACDTTCNTCGYKRAIQHKPAADWSSNDKEHWHVCTVCGVKLDLAAHVPGAPATVGRDQNCTVCGLVLEKGAEGYQYNAEGHWSTGNGTAGSGDYEAHNFNSTNVKSDANGHWYTCSGCGTVSATAPHSFNASGICDACGYAKGNSGAETGSSGTQAPQTTQPGGSSGTTDPGATTDPNGASTTVNSNETTGNEDPNASGKKCWLCGFCPCPLNICIFIWILIVIILVVVIIIIIKKASKKDDKKEEKKEEVPAEEKKEDAPAEEKKDENK